MTFGLKPLFELCNKADFDCGIQFVIEVNKEWIPQAANIGINKQHAEKIK